MGNHIGQNGIKHKIASWETLKKEVKKWQATGLKVIFTNGCFDLLHIGHVYFLQAAKSYGDKLIVALNSDNSVRKIKGDKRPIIPQNERAEILAALSCVDRVVIFDEPTPLSLINYLKPDVLIKGADWPEDAIVGKEVVLARGGKVIRIPLFKGISTTEIINRIIKRYNLSGDHYT
ncbi:MAG TPA: D-glycero-beta-D-manno-heptose 1-phosphate adenylyltransferase [Candidatus Desulfofervidus auxilii]|uniref:D-glycero-beta-D-manno-heptose 1-phosphate adenylyltransferase n=1 Tax=Desulfofervidus auxilii TaxID=1621989 RepID=A0A7V0IAQ4_DESA2|nr:D-glycero-beta-D-manno-heptose 1-phosphate adenylyltransferase [Candidatus Desulfofervidus auxilii]